MTYETMYRTGVEALDGVQPDFFDGVYEPLGRGPGEPAQVGPLADVYPLLGAAEYRGWYHITGSRRSRWCPRQSRFGGPRPGGSHGGTDLYSHGRETLLAITSGTIEYRPPQPTGWGNHIYLYFKRRLPGDSAPRNLIAVYAHVDPSSAFSGVKSVAPGDIIGRAGCSGNAGNAGACWRSYECSGRIAAEDHLHLELFPAGDPDGKIDPVRFFGWTVKFDTDDRCSECAAADQLI